MKKTHISTEWGLGLAGHRNFDFVDINLHSDNLLFIDPCLIEYSNTKWCQNASRIVKSFFDEFYRAYRTNDQLLKHSLLSHAREQNSTRLGYGSGNNGKGNSAAGLIRDFKPLELLINNITTIGTPQDIPVLIPGFAEDGLSDLLTNILHNELTQFTLEQMNKYGKKPNSTAVYYTWDISQKCWIKVQSPCYSYNGTEVLLVPKNIVRKNYLFGANQYFQRIILERMQKEDNWHDTNGKPYPKKDIAKNLQKEDQHWLYDEVINYSKMHNDALEEYHGRLQQFYSEYAPPMDDDELDTVIYDLADYRSNIS